MKLSSRTRYGMRAMMELAAHYGKKPVQIRLIAEHQEISNKYLEQLIAMLKSAGLVRSVRGPRGGYSLTRPPSQITLKEVFQVLEGPIAPADCLDHPEYCKRYADCAAREIWKKLQDTISEVLSAYTLADLAKKYKAAQESQ